jgi:hypothetical protein
LNRRLVVLWGEGAPHTQTDLPRPLGRRVAPARGRTQSTPPSIAAFTPPSFPAALDEEQAKRAFWKAFRVLGDWYAEFPPY